MDVESELRAIDSAALTEPVRALLGDAAAVVRTWERVPFLAGTGDFVHRLSGAALVGGREVPWTLVLKLVPGGGEGTSGRGRQRGAWWANEAHAYRSGVLAQLPGDLAAPRCFGAQDRPGGAVWLWLEEVVDDLPGAWPLSRYVLAARHLGAFNGALPEPQAHDWLSRGWLREWVERDGWGGGWRVVLENAETWQHPLMRRAYPVPVAERLLSLHAGRTHLLDALDRLPHTLAHLDAFRRNLFSRRLPDGRDQTIAIDWPSIGYAALGEELGKMVSTSVLFFELPSAQAADLLDAATAGYLAGLQDAGWTLDDTLVRTVHFAARTSASLHWACTAAAFPYVIVTSEREGGKAWVTRVFGCTPEELIERWAPITYWLLDLADEARSLLPAA